jgi:ribosomal protein S18 acetylase RimI-like enzyme
LVRAFSDKDAKAVARLHQDGITTGFLTQLGNSFLSKLYIAIAHDKQSIVYVMVDESSEEVRGFIAATCNTPTMYKRILLKHAVVFSALLIPVILKPGFIRKAIETLFYTKRPKQGEKVSEIITSAELLAIAVTPEIRGKGVGRTLVSRLEEYFLARELKKYKVVTASKDNRSNAFYQNIGFYLMRQFTHHGNCMNEYAKEIVGNKTNK